MHENRQFFFRRRRLRLSQGDVARELGVSTVAISLFESGARDLPFGMTSDEYEAALERLVQQRAVA